MTEQPNLEARVTALENQMERAAADAKAARHLAAAQDRDLSEFAIKIDANRQAINELSVQTAERFQDVDRRFDALEAKVDAGHAEMRGGFAEMRAGFAAIGGRLDTLIERDGGTA